jgi:hypothetical protein
MPLWRFYTSYPKPYGIVSDTIYNANPEFASRLLGSYAIITPDALFSGLKLKFFAQGNDF